MKPWVIDRIRAANAEGAVCLTLNRANLTEIPRELLELANLTSLDLSRNRIRSEDIRKLSALTKLSELSLSSNRISVDGIRMLSTLTNLTSLDFRNNCLGSDEIRALCRLTQLTSLDLSNNGIDAAAADALSGLTNLRVLVLSGNLIRSEGARALAALTNLRILRISRNRIGAEGAKALSSLTNLTTLDLRRNNIGTAGAWALCNLTNLATLDLSKNRIGDEGVRALSTLTKLTALDLSKNRIGNEGARTLSTHTNLSTLKLWANRIDAHGALALSNLTNLTTLDLSLNSIGEDGARAVSKLAKLITLNLQNNGIGSEGARALSNLTNLTTLDLSGNRIGDEGVRALSRLTALTTLRLVENKIGLDGARALTALTNLRSLSLGDNPDITAFEPLLPLLDQLTSLDIHGCQIDDPPKEVWQSTTNVLASLRAHYRDCELGKDRDSEFKVCVLGNGHVGKTQMCRRLMGNEYDDSISTTHGIQLGHLDQTIDRLAFRLNLWDFGGQEIYHGSHALFLQGQAIFAILWNPDFEQGEYPDGGTVIRHRPLSYWLDFVRGLAGTDAPVILVQSQCDQPSQRSSPEVSFGDFRMLRTLSFSAKTDFGLTVLRGELEDAVRDIVSRKPPAMIGEGRIEIRNQLREMLEQDSKLPEQHRRHRTLPLEDFNRLCADNGKISSPSELLRYLDRCGVVFYRPGVFNNRIILDQDWALKAIYTVFDRQGAFRALNRYGRFTRTDLAVLAWQQFTEPEQRLFLSMMQSCGVCFPVRKVSINGRQKEWEYAAPELLPEWSGIQDLLLDRMQGERNIASIEVRYQFLHEGILRSFLSKLGRKAGDAAIYWKYGCWFHEATTASQLLARSELDPTSGRGCVNLRAIGERPRALLDIVLKELVCIPIGHPPDVHRSWESPTSAHEDSELVVEFADSITLKESHDLSALKVSERPDLPASGKRAIYISYAWGDDESDAGRERQATVEGLCAMLEAANYAVIKDDRAMRHGDWISDFMKLIGRGDHIVVILSEKYLRSPYCMTELFHIYSRSIGDKRDFLNRVIPVVVEKSLKLNDWSVVAEHAEYWEQEFLKMEPKLKYLGPAHIARYHLIKQWHTVIATILEFVSDTLRPQGFDAIVKDDYAAVREMLPPP